MNILHASTYEVAGGASAAALRLHLALLRQGFGSQLAVLEKQGESPRVHLTGGKLVRRIVQPLLRNVEAKLFQAMYSRPQCPAHTSYSILPSQNARRLNAIPRDILHLHWVGEGFITPYALNRLRGPVVWTMHDTFAFTGGCHYTTTGCKRFEERCGHCPELCSHVEMDLSRMHWLLKREAILRLKPVIVSPSVAYAERAKRSGMLHDCRIEVIPNGLDTDTFRPIPKALARSVLNLPQEAKLVLFGAVQVTGDANKGFDLLHDALQRLQVFTPTPFAALIFGGAMEESALPCPVYFLGRLHDSITLALAYAAADVFVCPSRQENFPNTIMEAMACGTPTAAFSVGGIPDMVENGCTGLLADAYDTTALASAIGRILSSPESAAEIGRAAREKAVREYSLPVLVKRYTALYEDIML